MYFKYIVCYLLCMGLYIYHGHQSFIYKVISKGEDIQLLYFFNENQHVSLTISMPCWVLYLSKLLHIHDELYVASSWVKSMKESMFIVLLLVKGKLRRVRQILFTRTFLVMDLFICKIMLISRFTYICISLCFSQ